MPKEKDYSVKLVDLLASEDFKVLLGDLGEDVAAMAAQADKYFDNYGSARIMLVNNKINQDDRRVAIATLYKEFKEHYSESYQEFYVEAKISELDPEKVLDILIDDEMFQKRYQKLSKKVGYNDTVMTLSKEFMVKPSLVAKYARTK